MHFILCIFSECPCFLPLSWSCNTPYLGRYQRLCIHWSVLSYLGGHSIRIKKNCSEYRHTHRGRQVINPHSFLLSGAKHQHHFSRYCFCSWHKTNSDIFVYIWDQLRVYSTKLFFQKRNIAISTHHLVYHVFFRRLFLLTLFYPTPIPIWSTPPNVYRKFNHGQEMVVHTIRMAVGAIVALLWSLQAAIFGVFSSPPDPILFIYSCLA